MEVQSKAKILITVIWIAMAVLFLNVMAAPSYTISGNSVFIDDANAYISVTPHTISRSGWVYFNVTSKTYSGDIDVVWGFDTSEAKPKRAQLYKPTFTNTTRSFSCPPPYWYNHTTDPKHVWCWEDYVDGNGTVTRLVGEASFEWADLPSYTVYWNDQSYAEWKDIKGQFGKVNYDFDGKDTWHYMKDIPIVAGQSYLLRAWVEVPFCPLWNASCVREGKYDFAIKPSHLSIHEAIAQGKFYFIDPWYDAGKSNKYAVTCLCTACSANTTFAVLVNDTAARFGAGVTDQYFECEWDIPTVSQICGYVYLNDETDYECVNSTETGTVPMSINQGNMSVYGNPYDALLKYAFNVSSGTAVEDSTGNKLHSTATGVVWNSTGRVGYSADFEAGESDKIIGDATTLNDMANGTIMVWLWYESAHNSRVQRWWGDSNNYWEMENVPSGGLNRINFWGRTGGTYPNIYTSSTKAYTLAPHQWYHIAWSWNSVDGHKVYVNGTLVNSSSTVTATGANYGAGDLRLGTHGTGGYFDGLMDEYMVLDRTLSADEIALYVSNTNGTQDVAILGAIIAQPAAGDLFYNVTLESPPNGTITNDDTPDFSFRFNGTYWTASCELFVGGTGFGINATTVNDTSTTITANTSIADVQNTPWYVNCTNSTGATNQSDTTRYITIDTDAPDINLLYPANFTNLSTVWLNITGEPADINADSVYINDTDFGNNLGTFAAWNFTNTTIPEGLHSFLATANDTAGNTNSTELHITIDRTAPVVTFLTPTPNNEVLAWDGCWVNVSTVESGTNISSCTLDWNGTNQTISLLAGNNYRTSKTVPDGNYTFRVYCNDSAGNLGATASRWVFIQDPPFSPGNPMGGWGGTPPWDGPDIERDVVPVFPWVPDFDWSLTEVLAMLGVISAVAYVLLRI